MSKYLLAHDLGTSGNKATLFSTTGKLIGSSVHSYNTRYFNTTWVEQDANDWWKAVCESTKSLISETKIDASDIISVSFSGQMMGCLCVDKNGVPLRPSMIWADSRAINQVKQIEAKISQWDYYKIVGHRNTASYGLHKLMWIKENEPEIYDRTYKTLNAKDYIVYKLTGNFYTDYSDANSCGFFDLEKLDWSQKLISFTGISLDKLPEPKPSSFKAGSVSEAAAMQCGLAEGTPVIIGSGDGVASNVGAGSILPGKTYCCIGTSAWITTTSKKPLLDKKMQTVTWAHMIPGLYAPNGTMQYAGGAYNWLRNEICKGTTYEIMNSEADTSCAGANGIVFLPYMLGERAPRWDADAKGCFLGITPENTRSDIIRSVLEGVTLNLSLILDILRNNNLDISEITVLGGGAKSQTWQKILADILLANILVPNLLEEAASMGAAVNAGVGIGYYKDYTAIEDFITIRNRQSPNPDTKESYEKLKIKFENYYNALKPVFPLV
ncbi:MAG: xylulokinase [Suipraeoptans sp.]